MAQAAVVVWVVARPEGVAGLAREAVVGLAAEAVALEVVVSVVARLEEAWEVPEASAAVRARRDPVAAEDEGAHQERA